MRQEHETATSFNQLKEITLAIHVQKRSVPTNATNQESEHTQASHNANAKAHTPEPTQAHTQASENANISDLTQKKGLKPKTSTQTKKGALKPTKKAFSERQITTIRDNSQASANKSQETEQANQQGNNANAFKSDEAFKQGLRTQQRGQE
ncbi:hypothetical protein ACLGB3_07125 [Helicobacter pylori]